MTATATARPGHATAGDGPSLARLTFVELRKAADTRAGFWLIMTVVVLEATTVCLTLGLGNSRERTLGAFVLNAQLPVSVLLPALAVLLVTGEWSQRTALNTFSLVPARERIVAAKLFAATVLATAAAFAGLAVGAVGFAIGGAWDRTTGGWHMPVSLIGQLWLMAWINMICGAAFGLLLLYSAPAIVTFYVLPNAWAIVGRLVPGLDAADQWLDLGRTLMPLLETGMTGLEWAKLLTASSLWLGLPAGMGLLRIRRTEIH